ncbi:5'-methylthioadenosine/adenosylhomocysteine nucleosidase [uncultured Xylophilus sp.]|uniref:5'-methylthioadenosine/adenosylhomocysteine nucleosidase n=1 Tax=uncultured Xylophilus sp. TaxID=296832 RepID=UPI0026007261|nr:5'-methylthioadenosine/adenosylhomocysteine nucleosidase [uncultured Xylophilus sp.]
MTIAILSALPEEQHGLAARMSSSAGAVQQAGRSFTRGVLAGHDVVLALSGIGKVAAATTATVLAERFGVRRVLFTGVAGGLGAGVRVGDVVVAEACLQHDMDASPLFPRHEVPLYGIARFPCDAALTAALRQAADAVAADAAAVFGPAVGTRYGLDRMGAHTGLLLSGDRFVSSQAASAALRAEHPDALAVEMEAAAVAQVCHDYRLPFAAMRTISDRADDAAHVDFPAFLRDVAGLAACAVVGRWLDLLSKE